MWCLFSVFVNVFVTFYCMLFLNYEHTVQEVDLSCRNFGSSKGVKRRSSLNL